jgi:hypothetical protein
LGNRSGKGFPGRLFCGTVEGMISMELSGKSK